MANTTDFLGTGWSFPPSFEKNNQNTVVLVSDDKDIQQSLQILLTTRIGERVMQPTYGADTDRLIFEPINLSLISLVKDIIEKAIVMYEPRIEVSNIDINQDGQTEGLLLISIDYVIRTTNTRNNIVFPFYIIEGNNIV